MLLLGGGTVTTDITTSIAAKPAGGRTGTPGHISEFAEGHSTRDRDRAARIKHFGQLGDEAVAGRCSSVQSMTSTALENEEN
jgi:hypothetical protein